MAEITEAQVVVKGEFDGQKLVAGLNAVSKLGKKAAKDSDLLNMAMGKISDTAKLLGGDLKNAVGLITKGFDSLNQKIDAQASRVNRLNSALRGTINSYKNVDKTLEQASKMFGGNTSREAAQANRFNSANFLAQFQDIAVTSAMGMNPALIAMQQGTQLQYILAQSNAPLKDFVAGLKSAFSAMGLLTIGITGLIASLIQMVDWTSVGKSMLNGLSEIFKRISENTGVFVTAITLATATLLTFNGSAVIATIWNLTKLATTAIWAGGQIAAGWVLAMGPVGMVLSAITLVTTAWLAFPEGVEKIFKSVGTFIKNTLNEWIGLILSFGYQVSGMFDVLANAPFTGWSEAVQMYENQIAEIRNADYLGYVGKGLIAVDDATGNLVSDVSKGLVDGFKKASSAASDTFKNWSDGLGKTEEKIKKTKTEVDKLAQAWDRINVSAQNKIDDLLMQKSLIGAGTYETTYNRTLTDLTRQAEGAGIELTPEKTAELKDYAESSARLSEQVERLTARYDLAKSSVKSLFSEMRQGLKEGESAWEAFGNAALSVLDKLIDKALDFGVDMLFMAGRSYFGGSTLGTNSSAMPMLGGEYAKGGVFSNGVYDSPTVFKFAKGGKFGVMGEAGPEAVMPLTRGPDGSLGVRAENTGNSSPVVVNVINNSTAQARVEQRQTSQGVELDVIIDQLVAEKMNKPGTSSNTALRAFSNQKLIAR